MTSPKSLVIFSVALNMVLIAILIFPYIDTEKDGAVQSEKVAGDFQSAYGYLEAHGCRDEMSNNTYMECAEKALKQLKTLKTSFFNKFQGLLKNNPSSALVSDAKLSEEFFDWYKKSDDFNKLRCSANMYWTGAGSAYNQNMATCQIFETQRDINLLDELYTKRGYFRDWE